eukprot:gene3087-5257_t
MLLVVYYPINRIPAKTENAKRCAEEAINTYTKLFQDSKIINLVKYGKEAGESEGKIMTGTFQIKGIQMMAHDSPVHHEFPFTSRVSQFVTCNDEKEIDNYFTELSKGGKDLMDLGNHGFSKKFAWVDDKFGVSWQLNLP